MPDSESVGVTRTCSVLKVVHHKVYVKNFIYLFSPCMKVKYCTIFLSINTFLDTWKQGIFCQHKSLFYGVIIY